jgi:glycosyltransferase involved in cell wall biosynthesis
LTLPLVSVVMPCLNQAAFIEQALTSVLGQAYPCLELIVIDGGSTDGTLEVIERHADQIAYWVSEPDRGQAHAINKGFRQARGEVLAWLNADDMYLPCAVQKAAQALSDREGPALVYGGCLHFHEGTARAHGYWPEPFDADRLTYFDYIVQPSTFWSSDLWEATGDLDESLRYGLDWDWFIRASHVGTFEPLYDHLAIYRKHEGHKTGSGGDRRAEELVRIVETYSTPAWGAAYRDVAPRASALKATVRQLKRRRLYRMRRFLLGPYRQHGTRRVDTVLAMFD